MEVKVTMEKTQNKKLKKTYINKDMIVKLAPFIGFIVIVVFFAIITNGTTVSSVNLKILTNQMVVTALVATGAVYCFATGALDMSMGASVCLSAVIGAKVAVSTGSPWAMFVVCIGISLLVGIVKGLMSAYMKLPVFIVTIVVMSVLSSIALLILGNETTISLPMIPAVKDMTLINIMVLGAFFIFAMIVFNYTKVGKSCKLQGGNPIASAQSGINANKNIIISFLMGAIGVGLGAFMILLRTRTVSATTGGSLGMDIMIAIVLGGMPLSGGPRSKISSAVIGAATITVLNNGLQVMGLSTGSIQIVRGIIFLVVVFITSMSYRTKLLPR